MRETKSHDYAWSKSWIEFEAPNAQGVYSLRDKEGRVIYVGKGNIRERLLSHWNHENAGDLAILDHNPYTFRFELSKHPAQRQAELVRELQPLHPLCPPVSHSLFSKLW